MGLAGLGAGRFNHIRVNRPVGQPLDAPNFTGLFVEYLDKRTADDLALVFRVFHALQCVHEALFGVDAYDMDAHVFGKGIHGLFAYGRGQFIDDMFGGSQVLATTDRMQEPLQDLHTLRV